jgi:glycosyltransferase involved in cell wall biosynthesis
MRVLIDAHHIGARQTGNETWIRNVSRELVAIDDQDELEFTASSSGRAQVRALVGRDPWLVSASSLRRLAIDMPRLARQLSADVSLVQYTMPVSRVPAVVMIHDLSVFDPAAKQWLSSRFRTRVQASIRVAARRAACLLAPSEFTRRHLIEDLGVPPARVRVAVNAVDPALARLLDSATAADRAPAAPRVLAVGNVLPRKNLTVLAQAVARLRASAGSRAVLRVVGSVPEASRPIADEIRRTLGESVSFTGYVDDGQLASEYASADVLAFPSLFEGFGIPVLEAMHAGLPVVVSDRGALADVAGGHATVVAAADVQGWASALDDTLRDSDAARREQRRAHAASYSWPASAASVLSALRGAVATGGHQ